MGKLTAIETYARFETLWEGSQISDTSLTFILDTGQLYTHGFFLNSVSYGTEASGYVPIRVAGVTKNISLQGHTHSGYYSNSADIDIGSNKIVSGTSDLLKFDSGNIIIGNSDNPTYLYGTLTTTRNDNNYTILDTGNFSITQTTSNNLALSNVATFRYGSSTFQLDYVKRVEVISTFDLQNSYTNFGTISEASKWYGFMTMYTDSNTTNPRYAQIRVDITNNKLEYRTSSHTTWSTALEGGSYVNLPINGTNYQIVTKAATLPNIWAPSALGNAKQVLSVSNDGESLAWRDMTNLTASNKGVKITNDVITLELDSDTLNTAEIGGKFYAVELDKNGKLAVNVPWTSTTTINSKVDDGYVLKGQNHPNKVWMTNDQGEPDWRDLDVTNTLTAATVNTLGLVKVYDIVNVPFTAEPTNAPVNGRYYGVQMDGGNKLFVNIPWINTWNPYTAPTESAAGTAGYITPPAYQDIDKFLRADGSWVIPTNTWKAANTSQEGYVPMLAAAATDTIATQSSEYVLTYISGTETTPVWRKLPTGAFNTVNNGILYIKSSVNSTATELARFGANQSDSSIFTLVKGDNITFTNDTTNHALIIAGTPNTWRPIYSGDFELPASKSIKFTYTAPISISTSYSDSWDYFEMNISLSKTTTNVAATTLDKGTWKSVAAVPSSSSEGLYILYFKEDGCSYAGLFSYNGNSNDYHGEEIIFHTHGAGRRIYAKVSGGSIYITTDEDSITTDAMTFKFVKLI